MEININLNKKISFALIGILLFSAGFVFINALTASNPGHVASSIWIKTAQLNQKTLQEAINHDLPEVLDQNGNYLSNYIDRTNRDIIGPVAEEFTPYTNVCSFCHISTNPTTYNIGKEDFCYIKSFYNGVGSGSRRGGANLVQNSDGTWNVTLKNTFATINCFNRISVDCPIKPIAGGGIDDYNLADINGCQ